MKRPLLIAATLALSACPPPPPVPDAGPPDAGETLDAGHDAGRVPRDAGVDAGWPDVAIADWCHHRAVALCWRDIRCGSIDDSLLDNCTVAKTAGCDQAAYSTSNALGFHVYDPKQAARCLNGYDHGSCEETPAECRTVFAGRSQPDGGFALVPEDCDPDAGYLYRYAGVCPMFCRPWAELGDSCDDAEGLFFYLNPQDGGTRRSCRPGVHSCDIPDGGSDSVCVPLQREGEYCQDYYSCAPGYVCLNNACVKEAAETGQACALVSNYYPHCKTEDFCRQPPGDAGVCAKRGTLGGVCTGYGSCLPSLRCTSTIGTGTCERRAGLNEACSSSFSTYPDCMDGLRCAYATSRCTPVPGDGGACGFDSDSYNQCANGFWCDQFYTDQCLPKLNDGEPCRSSAACWSGQCFYGTLPDGGSGSRCARCTSDGGG